MSWISLLSFCAPPTAGGGEVYDPITDPLCHIGYHIVFAALENPNSILVASLPLHLFANFFIYDVEKCCWKTLDPACRKINSKCPLGIQGKAVAVGNYLYWITEDVHLLAFGFNLDLWLTGNFKGLNIAFLEYDEPALTGFSIWRMKDSVLYNVQLILIHLIVMFNAFYLLSPMPEKKSLRVSIVSTIKYRPYCPLGVLFTVTFS